MDEIKEKPPAIIWFRDDLRTQHHEALAAAAEHGPVVAVYIAETPETTGIRPLGGAAQWWLHHSLDSLADNLAKQEVPLIIRSGDPRELIPELVSRMNAGFVSWSRRYHRPQRDIDVEVKHALRSRGVEAHSYPGHLLAEPWTVSTTQGKPYKVYTPFSRTLRTRVEEILDAKGPDLKGAPIKLAGPGADLETTRAQLFELALLPTHPSRREPDWTTDLKKLWSPGETGAWQRLSAFLDDAKADGGTQNYAEDRDFPGRAATSRLSPHLRFGEISPLSVWSTADGGVLGPEDSSVFHKELMWRDFAWHRLYHLPDLATTNVRAEFNSFPWAWTAGELKESIEAGRDGRRGVWSDGDHFADLGHWRAGTTGIPLVDAGMRELWTTGHMHNRVRMVVGSFLTKNLGIHWRHGEEWFWDTLVDADPASNAFNWQWVAGCGDDAAPFFRIFNPLTQAQRFDPTGDYVSTWAPETHGADYPEPIIDLRESREMALTAYQLIRNSA